MDINTCLPIASAGVNFWHCDAFGIYSHCIQTNPNVENDNQTFLGGN